MTLEHPFDSLSRSLGAQRSRRSMFRQLGAALVGGMTAAVFSRAAWAATPCAPGLVSCAGSCVDLLSDAGNCGACGTIAPPGGRCADGTVLAPAAGPGPAPAQNAAP